MLCSRNLDLCNLSTRKEARAQANSLRNTKAHNFMSSKQRSYFENCQMENLGGKKEKQTRIAEMMTANIKIHKF